MDVRYKSVGTNESGPMENVLSRGEVCGLAFGSVGELALGQRFIAGPDLRHLRYFTRSHAHDERPLGRRRQEYSSVDFRVRCGNPHCWIRIQ